MPNIVTIHVDESGSPVHGVEDDGLFVVGGVALLGAPGAVAGSWQARMPDHKGRKYTRDDMLNMAEFVSSQGVVPIASHCRLTEEDRDYAQAKAAMLQAELGRKGGDQAVRAPVYLWSLQVAQTVVSSALGSLPFVLGDVNQVDVFIDQFALPTWFRERLDRWLPEWFDPAHRFQDIVAFLETQAPGHPDIVQIRQRVSTSKDSTSFNWRSRGPLHRLADAIASVYRRKLNGDRDAAAAWAVMEVRYTRNGRPALCMNMDVSNTIRAAVRREVCS